MSPLQHRLPRLLPAQQVNRAIPTKSLCRPQRLPLSALQRSRLVTGSYHWTTLSRSLTSSTEYNAVTQEDSAATAEDATAKHNGNVSVNPDTGASSARTDPHPSWGTTAEPEEDWRGSKSFSLKDVDWGM